MSATTVLTPVVQKLNRAVKLDGSKEKVESIEKDFFLDALLEYVKALGDMGQYLKTNTDKFAKSPASASEKDYYKWLESELPLHEQTGYRCYVDESAWMANLWAGWTLEFFVEMYALLAEGKETQPSATEAHTNTLADHQGYIARSGLRSAIGKMPPRDEFLKQLQGPEGSGDPVRDFEAFVAIGRPLYKYMLETNSEIEQKMTETRKAYDSGKLLGSVLNFSQINLTVTVIRAQNLEHLNMTGDAYWVEVLVRLKDGRTKSCCKTETSNIPDALNPEWNATLQVEDWEEGEELIFKLWDVGLGGFNKCLGCCILESKDFYPDGSKLMVFITSIRESFVELPPALEIKVDQIPVHKRVCSKGCDLM